MYLCGKRFLKQKNNVGRRNAHLIWKTRLFLIKRAVISSSRNGVPVSPFSSLGIAGSKQIKTALKKMKHSGISHTEPY